MALFKIAQGSETNLSLQSVREGYAYFTPDTGHFFIDIADSSSPAIVADSTAQNPNANRIRLTAGNADTATKLATARTISLTGAVTGSGSFDGSGNLSIATTVNHSHAWSDITGKPSTFTPSAHTHDNLYVKKTGDTMTGNLTISHLYARTVYSDKTRAVLWVGKSNAANAYIGLHSLGYYDNDGNWTDDAKYIVYRAPGSGGIYLNGRANSLPDRTLTIGSTGKTFNGTANVSWSLAEIGAAATSHTHSLSIATDSGTNALTLAASTKYKLTAGGSTFIFTTPPNTTYTFTAGTSALAWNSEVTLATVGGLAIKAKLPENPINALDVSAVGGETGNYISKISEANGKISATVSTTSVSNTWANGTTAGPTIKTTVNGIAGAAVAIPSASSTHSGIVTTDDQTFSGIKYFNADYIHIRATGNTVWPAIHFGSIANTGTNYTTITQNDWNILYTQFAGKKNSNGTYYQNRFFFRSYSDDGAGARVNHYEDYYLPQADRNRTTESSYDIYTSKNGVPWSKITGKPDLTVSDPSASGTSTTFIKMISQASNGKISVTKANLPTASTSVAGIIKIGTTANDAAAGDHNHNSVYKKIQTAVSNPDAENTAIAFVYSISQNTQGVITPTRRTVRTMTGATADAAGTTGVVPAPAKGKQTSFLRGDGTWVVPTNTTYTIATGDNNGQIKVTPSSGSAYNVSVKGLGTLAYLSKGTATTTFLRNDGTWTNTLTGSFISNRNSEGVCFSARSNDKFYMDFDIDKIGTTSELGYATVHVGNNIASGTANNARGRIYLYSNTAYCAKIYAAADYTDSQNVYIPAYAGTMYLAHVSSASAVGSADSPVYVAANGRITQCRFAFGNYNATTQLWGIRYNRTDNFGGSNYTGTHDAAGGQAIIFCDNGLFLYHWPTGGTATSIWSWIKDAQGYWCANRAWNAGISVSWNKGRDSAVTKTTSINSYSATMSVKTTNGSWDIGAYDNDSYKNDLLFNYVADTVYNGSSATVSARIKFLENGHIVGALDGNASTATKLATARTISLTGAVTGSGSFDGSGNLSIATTVNHSHAWSDITGKPSTFTPSAHTHGNLTNAGELNTPNRLAYTDENKKLKAGNHYADSTHVSIGSTAVSDFTLYVDGHIGLKANSHYYMQYKPGNTVNNYYVLRNHNNSNVSVNACGGGLHLGHDYGCTGIYFYVKDAQHGYVDTSGVHTAVWNDFAECRESEITEAGRVVVSNGKGQMILATERMQPTAHIISDTYGCVVGESDTAKTPLGVAGRVLVYPYRDRTEYKIGDCLCTAPNGTADIMTREEIITYPDRIIGIVDEIPLYENWQQTFKSKSADDNNTEKDIDTNKQLHISIPVKGRIWVYVR